MENLKFIISSIFILVLLGGSGYWAFTTMESGSTHVDNQKQKELEQQNVELAKEIAILKNEIDLLNKDKEQQKEEVIVDKIPEPVVTTTPTTPTIPKVTVSKYQSLIDELQKLVNGNIYLKSKSQGPAVGTIQKFLNIYNNTSLKVDNDYGLSTSNAIKSFQKAQGLSQDGQTGPNTYKKMITWLKSH